MCVCANGGLPRWIVSSVLCRYRISKIRSHQNSRKDRPSTTPRNSEHVEETPQYTDPSSNRPSPAIVLQFINGLGERRWDRQADQKKPPPSTRNTRPQFPRPRTPFRPFTTRGTQLVCARVTELYKTLLEQPLNNRAQTVPFVSIDWVSRYFWYLRCGLWNLDNLINKTLIENEKNFRK